MLGMGVMLHRLGGGSEQSAETYYGRKIVAATMDDDKVRLSFSDGKAIEIFDDGQSCCENRYMRSDDDLQALVGQTLACIEAKSAPNEPDEYCDHEVCFVEIGGNQSCVTLANHNEHNGYYGGFGLTIKEIDPA